MGRFDYKYRHIDCIYEGEHIEHVPNGFGKLYIKKQNTEIQLVYVGQWKYGKAHGKGKTIGCDLFLLEATIGIQYPYVVLLPDISDEFNLIKPNAFNIYEGSLNRSNVYYVGDFFNGRIVGKGKVYSGLNWYDIETENLDDFLYDNEVPVNYEKYLLYTGEFLNGKFSGYGEFIDYQNKTLVYKGYFKNSSFDGNGIIYLNDKILIEGNFDNNFLEGNSKVFYPNGYIRYLGEFKKDFLNGQGKEFNKKGVLISEGIYKSGKLEDGRFSNPIKNLFINFIKKY